jgi:hypothetical protein
MMSTETAFSTAQVQDGSEPDMPHAKKVTVAIPITARTKPYDTRSARRCIGARERCASATSATICASIVSAPTRSARMTRLPLAFCVPPIRCSPGPLLTGGDSPVRSDSSTLERPSSTSPSTGTLSPGRTRSRSPACTWSSGISSSPQSARSRRATGGARRSRALIAAEVDERARSSRSWPSSASKTITAAASK